MSNCKRLWNWNNAKIYHFTCVTNANEVIYGGGYLTHMGHFDYNKQRISLYSKLSELNKKYIDCESIKRKINEHKEEIMNQELQIQQGTVFLLKIEVIQIQK